MVDLQEVNVHLAIYRYQANFSTGGFQRGFFYVFINLNI